MNCVDCNKEIPGNAKFCPHCGSKVPPPQPIAPQFADELIIKQVDPILKPNMAARLLGISRWKLDELRIQNRLPQGTWFEIPSAGGGKRRIIRYRTKELLHWANNLDGYISTVG